MSRFEDNRLFVLNDSHAPRLSPALAQEIGLNESILFLQLEFLIAVRGVLIQNRTWIKMSVRDLVDEFPFLSSSTINRALQSLINRQLLIAEDFNEAKYDKTRWFSINLEAAAKLQSIAVKWPVENTEGGGHGTRSNQNGTGSTQNGTRSTQDGTRSNQNETTIERESGTETKTESTLTSAPAPVVTQAGGVCVKSRFSFEERVAYARNQSRIKNPEGFAASERAEEGKFDEAIAAWQLEQERPNGTKLERDVRECPDCQGTGWWYPDGQERGAARCRHPRLLAHQITAPGLFDSG